ncbi:MAG TPA: condensation domain-containing protein, partial [Pseudomonadales bacterium]
VRRQLARELPDYMVPVHIIRLDAWPLSANGKIDRKALPKPDRGQAQQDYVAPQTPLQQQLVEIWQQLLPAGRIGINDNFFELGGHSLLAIRVLAAIAEQTGVELPVQVLFESPTIAMLAEVIEHSDNSTALPPLQPVERQPLMPVSYNQQRLWFLAQMDSQSAAYNMPAALKISGTLDKAALQQAFDSLIERQEILRCNIVAVDGEPQLQIHPPAHFNLQQASVAGADELQQQIQQHASQPFDLASDSLLKATLLHCGEQQHVLLLNLHHSIGDGLSVQILIRELAALYLRHAHQLPVTLPPLPVQYADVAHWQRSWLQGEALEKQLAFWRQTLHGVPRLLSLPLDHPRPPVQRFIGAQLDVDLPPALVESLRSSALANGSTLFMLMLAAYQLLLHKLSKQQDICIGIPLAGRSMAGVENLIGFFINALVIRGDLSANLSLAELLQQVRSRVLAAFAHEHVPIEMLLNELGIERNLAYTPVVQCALNMMAGGDDSLQQQISQLPGDLQLELLHNDGVVAKFDLQFNLLDDGDTLGFSIDYNSDIFERATVARLADAYIRILQAFADNTDTRLQQIQLEQPAVPAGCQKVLPLTLMQRDIYLASLAKPHTTENSLGFAMELPLAINVDVWRQVLQGMTASCEILRADVISCDSPWQEMAYLAISEHAEVDFELLDWSAEALDADTIKQRLDALIWRPFDVRRSVRTAYRLIKMADDRYWMTMSAHHMILDGYAVSMQGVIHIAEYEKLLADPQHRIALPDNFADYIAQNRHDFDNKASLDYWREQLAKADSLDAPGGRGHENRLLSLNVPDGHLDAVKKYCRAQKITPALYFKTLYAWLIYQYSQAESAINIIEFHAGRSKENRDSLGCFYHTYPSVIDVAGLAGSTTEAFQTLREQQKNSKNFLQVSPLQMRRLTPPSRLNFSYNFLMMPHHTHIFGERINAIRYTPNAEGVVDMRIQADEEQLSFWLAYNSALFDDNRFLERLLSISEQLLAGDVPGLAALNLCLADETLPNSLPALAAPLVHQAITAQALRTPAAIAVQCGSESLCYSELEARSNALAHALIQRGVQRGDRVGVCLGRRVELLVAILAVIKAGGCYVPMDVSYPAERLAYMLDDCEATLVISEDCMAERLSVVADRLVSVDEFPFADFSTDAPAVAI